VNCYELDILDENAFLQWKENVNDNFEGKGKALFQVKSLITTQENCIFTLQYYIPGEPMVVMVRRSRL
jgi:hypothetical protein